MGWWKDLPLEEKERLSALDVRALEREAMRLGVHPKTLYNRLREYKQSRAPQVIQPQQHQYTDFEYLKGDDWLILSDLEIPDEDSDLLSAAVQVSARYNIRRLVIAGDLLALDQFSTWPQVLTNSREMNLEDTLSRTRIILLELAKQFQQIVFFSGNHDQRLSKATNGQVHLGMLLANTPVRFSHYGYLYLETSRGPVYVCHPKSFQKDAIGLGQALYDVVLSPAGQKCHIVMAHLHTQRAGWTADALREIHALGCIRDPLRTQYKALAASKASAWIQGFLMLRQGYFYPFTKHGSNWREYLVSL